MSEQHRVERRQLRIRRYTFILAIGSWLLLILVGYGQIQRYAVSELRQQTRLWQQKLYVGGNYRKNQLEQWFRVKEQALKGLANNAALKLYLSAVLSDSERNAAESAYLMNFLLGAAEENGFTMAEREIDQVKANLPAKAASGIGVTNSKGDLVVGTKHLPNTQKLLAKFDDLTGNDVKVYGPDVIDHSPQIVVWSVPVYAVQANSKTDSPLGYIVATALLSEAMKVQEQDSLSYKIGTEGLLVHATQGQLEILSDADLSAPLTLEERQLLRDSISMPGEFFETTEGTKLALPVATSPSWYVVQSVLWSNALEDMRIRQLWLKISYWLTVVIFTLVVVLLWRSVMTQRLQSLLDVLSAHEKLLQTVMDALPARLFIVNRHRQYQFANKLAAEDVSMESASMMGKATESVMGRGKAQQYEQSFATVLTSGEALQEWYESGDSGSEKAIARRYVPLLSLPSVDDDALPAVLVMESDMTSLVEAQKARQQMQEKLIDTLVMLADQRDSHTKRHSQRVVLVSSGIAEAMQLTTGDRELIELSARLMNLGKLLVPEELLTSESKLQKKDRTVFDSSYAALLDYLKDIPFPFPVVDTLRAVYEPSKGGTPLPSEILKVANSFVALISPRAYRKAMEIGAALEELESGKVSYNKNVLAALKHYLRNLGGENALVEDTEK